MQPSRSQRKDPIISEKHLENSAKLRRFINAGFLVAWFQARSSGADPRHEVEAGSAGVSISDVKGYKYKYTPRDSSTIDYSTGATAEYDLTSPSTKATNNHQAEEDPIDSDVPDDGVGYYVVFSGSDYKYSGGKKMSTNDIGSDKALLTNVPLTENTFFDIRRHYYVKVDNVVSTKNEIVSLSLDGSSSGVNSTKQADTEHNSELHWKVTATNNYDIYINSSGNLFVEPTRSKAKSASLRIAPKCANGAETGSASSSSIFLDAGVWNVDGARIGIHHWGSDSGASWLVMKNLSGNVFFGNLPSGVTGFLFVRMDTSSSYDWANVWNQTNDIVNSNASAVNAVKGKYYQITGWDQGDCSGPTSPSTTTATSYSYDYYVFGSLSSWSAKTAGWQLTADASKSGYDYSISSKSLPKDSLWKVARWKYTTTTTTYKYSSTVLWTGAPSTNAGVIDWSIKTDGSAILPAGARGSLVDGVDDDNGGYNVKTLIATTAKIYFNSSSGATYIEAGYTVTLNKNSGTINSGNVTSYIAGIGATLPTDVTRDGYAFAGWYANAELTGARVTSIGTSETGNKTYYAKWVSKSSGTTYYATVDTGCSWSGIKVYIFSSSFASFGYTIAATAASPYANVYTFKVPTDTADGFLLFNSADSSPGGTTKQTGNIKASGSLNADSFGGAASTHNMIHIVTETDGNTNRKWEWMDFVSTKPTTDGYYISTSNAWGSTMMDTEYVPGANTALKMAHTVASSFTFQIWKIKNNNWYIYHTLAAACSAAASGAKLSISTAGTYDFYLNSNNAIYVTGHDVKKIEFSKLNGSTPVGDAGKFAMHVGDASMVLGESNVYSGNRYAYEQTIAVKAGDTFNITEGAGDRSNVQLAIDSTAADYVEGTGDPVDGKYSSFRIRLNGSYTFYWTTGTPNKLAIAPIPELGFGYYILKNQGTASQPAFSYGSCVKMKEVDSNESYANRAYYYSYYAKAGEVLAFRSYVDEVDTYYDNANGYYNGTSISGKTSSSNPGAYPVNATDHTSASASAKEHGIVIKSSNYYNFYIYWNSDTSKYEIRITTGDTASTFFKLNNINSSNVGDDNAVKGQNTAFILAVTFTANNPYATDIYANAMVSSSCNLRFTALLDTDISRCTSANEIYTTIKNAAYTKNSWGTCANGGASKGGSLAASNSSTHVLYIVIDYTPESTITAYSGILSFAIRAAQA